MQEVQPEVAREAPADLHAAHAVADPVQARRKDADAELARQHGEDPTRDAALGRMPTQSTQWPAASYSPHVVMTLRTAWVSSSSSTRRPVTGCTPRLASVAAMRLTS